MLENSFSVA